MNFECVAGRLNESLRSEVVDFWLSENALNEREARERAARLVGVARDGGIVGVSTAGITFEFLEGQPLFAYRTYVAASRRQQGIATNLLNASFDGLEQIILAQEHPQAIGVALRLPVALASVLDQHLLWPRTDFSFIGRTDGGDHLRVRYFDEVKLK